MLSPKYLASFIYRKSTLILVGSSYNHQHRIIHNRHLTYENNHRKISHKSLSIDGWLCQLCIFTWWNTTQPREGTSYSNVQAQG